MFKNYKFKYPIREADTIHILMKLFISRLSMQWKAFAFDVLKLLSVLRQHFFLGKVFITYFPLGPVNSLEMIRNEIAPGYCFAYDIPAVNLGL